MCPPTLLVGSGRDFFRVRQGTGDLRPVNGSIIDERAENTLQRIRRLQRGECGYADRNLKEKCKKARTETDKLYIRQTVCAHTQACGSFVRVCVCLCIALIITIQQCCSNISSSLLLADLNCFNFAA